MKKPSHCNHTILFICLLFSGFAVYAQGNKPEPVGKKNDILSAQLTKIYYDDQHYREQLDEIEQKYGSQSLQMKAQWNVILKLDSINQQKVTAIIDKHDWPRSSEIDTGGSKAIFLVIQHADLDMKLKYLLLIKDAVKKGLLKARDMAILEDRINTTQHKKQIYGSQLTSADTPGKYYVLPLEDPDNVDKRRAEVGMRPLREYLQYWKMDWDVEQYKKDLPKIEEFVGW